MSRTALSFLDKLPTSTNLYETVVFLSRLSREISRMTMDTQRLNLVEESYREALKRDDEVAQLTGSQPAAGGETGQKNEEVSL